MRYFVLIIVMAVCFVSCKKTNSSNTSVLFYNGTWSLSSISATWNNTLLTAGIAQGKSSGTADSAYVQAQAGTNLITLNAGTTELLSKNIYAAASAGSSFIFFDTSTVTAPVGILQLTDDLTLPDTAQLKFRFIDLVPDTSVKVDVWLVNGVTDSIRLDSASTFIGSTAVASSVQTFYSTKFYGGNYTVKVKQTATENVYVSAASYPFNVQGIYSIIFSGLLTGTGNTALKCSILHHHIP